jgi:hypothetical protein
MSEKIVAQEVEQKNDDSCVDAIAAIALVCLFVVVVVFWVSNQ